jgi:hypothetical protein
LPKKSSTTPSTSVAGRRDILVRRTQGALTLFGLARRLASQAAREQEQRRREQLSQSSRQRPHLSYTHDKAGTALVQTQLEATPPPPNDRAGLQMAGALLTGLGDRRVVERAERAHLAHPHRTATAPPANRPSSSSTATQQNHVGNPLRSAYRSPVVRS